MSGENAFINSETVGLTGVVVGKAAPCNLAMLSGFNSGPDQYIQLFNRLTAPADQTVPRRNYRIKADSNFSISMPEPYLYFSVGLVVSNSTTAATHTAGANDCQIYLD